jgi:glycosyltransferase involved in cell wall biosynthesis
MPRVSVIVPCYNEQRTIFDLLAALHAQTYPREELEVVIADGLSTDGTREVVSAFQQDHPDLRVKLVDNPQRIIPAGLNVALSVAEGEIIVRMDAHTIPARDYVAQCVRALDAGLGDNIGGIWLIRPGGEGWISQAIALAAAHPLGVGDAHYRVSRQAREVDTVPFGAFYRRTIERIGLFNENLLTNEDYEFNVRLRKAGGKVWLDPQIRSEYIARSTLSELARQYWRYGYWKAKMLSLYPHSVRWRQLLAPLFVALLVVLGIGSAFSPLARFLLALQVGIYALVLLAAGLQVSLRERSPRLILGVPLAMMIMHLSWGAAFLWSMLRSDG